MQLRYRGIPYESNSITLPVVETETKAQYGENAYSVRCLATNLEIANQNTLAYRGISVIEDIQRRFLGCTYSLRISFIPVRNPS